MTPVYLVFFYKISNVLLNKCRQKGKNKYKIKIQDKGGILLGQ